MSLKRLEVFLESEESAQFWTEEVRDKLGCRITFFSRGNRLSDVRFTPNDLRRIAGQMLLQAEEIEKINEELDHGTLTS